MHISEAEALFGQNFIGPRQVGKLLSAMGMPALNPDCIPPIEFPDEVLQSRCRDFLLVLGYPGRPDSPLDILSFRKVFGVDPDKSEPCLYNQDWYLKEDFVRRVPASRWYLLRKNVLENTRSVSPENLLGTDLAFPPAVLCVYTFFAFFLACGQYLWYHDFVWCSDTDHNGDRIYVGKYHDIDGVNKNGFSIHRHLALRPCYASIDFL